MLLESMQNALTEMQHGDAEISVLFFRQETEVHPNNPYELYMLARSLSAAGRSEEAREAAAKASSLQQQLNP